MTESIIQESINQLRERLTFAYKLDNDKFLFSNIDVFEQQLLEKIKVIIDTQLDILVTSKELYTNSYHWDRSDVGTIAYNILEKLIGKKNIGYEK